MIAFILFTIIATALSATTCPPVVPATCSSTPFSNAAIQNACYNTVTISSTATKPYCGENGTASDPTWTGCCPSCIPRCCPALSTVSQCAPGSVVPEYDTNHCIKCTPACTNVPVCTDTPPQIGSNSCPTCVCPPTSNLPTCSGSLVTYSQTGCASCVPPVCSTSVACPSTLTNVLPLNGNISSACPCVCKSVGDLPLCNNTQPTLNAYKCYNCRLPNTGCSTNPPICTSPPVTQSNGCVSCVCPDYNSLDSCPYGLTEVRNSTTGCLKCKTTCPDVSSTTCTTTSTYWSATNCPTCTCPVPTVSCTASSISYDQNSCPTCVLPTCPKPLECQSAPPTKDANGCLTCHCPENPPKCTGTMTADMRNPQTNCPVCTAVPQCNLTLCRIDQSPTLVGTCPSCVCSPEESLPPCPTTAYASSTSNTASPASSTSAVSISSTVCKTCKVPTVTSCSTATVCNNNSVITYDTNQCPSCVCPNPEPCKDRNTPTLFAGSCWSCYVLTPPTGCVTSISSSTLCCNVAVSSLPTCTGTQDSTQMTTYGCPACVCPEPTSFCDVSVTSNTYPRDSSGCPTCKLIKTTSTCTTKLNEIPLCSGDATQTQNGCPSCRKVICTVDPTTLRDCTVGETPVVSQITGCPSCKAPIPVRISTTENSNLFVCPDSNLPTFDSISLSQSCNIPEVKCSLLASEMIVCPSGVTPVWNATTNCPSCRKPDTANCTADQFKACAMGDSIPLCVNDQKPERYANCCASCRPAPVQCTPLQLSTCAANWNTLPICSFGQKATFDPTTCCYNCLEYPQNCASKEDFTKCVATQHACDYSQEVKVSAGCCGSCRRPEQDFHPADYVDCAQKTPACLANEKPIWYAGSSCPHCIEQKRVPQACSSCTNGTTCVYDPSSTSPNVSCVASHSVTIEIRSPDTNIDGRLQKYSASDVCNLISVVVKLFCDKFPSQCAGLGNVLPTITCSPCASTSASACAHLTIASVTLKRGILASGDAVVQSAFNDPSSSGGIQANTSSPSQPDMAAPGSPGSSNSPQSNTPESSNSPQSNTPGSSNSPQSNAPGPSNSPQAVSVASGVVSSAIMMILFLSFVI